MSFHVPNQFRVRKTSRADLAHFASNDSHGNNGLFIVKLARGQTVRVIATDGGEWEHVSVSREDRCPTWAEMCAVKALFWDDEDCVVQYHPPTSEHVNNHPFCLHLWRPIGVTMPMPPSIFVGIKELGVLPR
jgi:hypothetical protein